MLESWGTKQGHKATTESYVMSR